MNNKKLMLDNWIRLNDDDMIRFAKNLCLSMKEKFTFEALIEYNKSGIKIISLKHIKTGLIMNLIPGGIYKMGMSDNEEKIALQLANPLPFNINEFRPCHDVEIEPFLLTKYPLSHDFVVNSIPISKELQRFKFEGNSKNKPIFLLREEAEIIADKFEFCIPSEKQWEYACRSGNSTLFWFGNKLPGNNILANILATDYSLKRTIKNNFGLSGLFIGEWCKEHYRTSYSPHAKQLKSFVVRGGGGSLFWPWQNNCEWAYCMSAFRMPSKNTLDGTCSLRFVYDVPVL